MNPDTLASAERRLSEALDDLYGALVDPAEPYYDADGTRWALIGGGRLGGNANLFVDESQLAAVREECRALALGNEFAINGHENRISYIVGHGFSYLATPRGAPAGESPVDEADAPSAGALAAKVQAVVDEFLEVNRWRQRQQEIVRRRDRDGECFLRLFFGGDGRTRVRFVEPDQVATPCELRDAPGVSFGIRTEPDDVETVLGYYIDGQAVPAAEVQHRKGNVDGNVRRGLPLFYPVRKNLRRAEKLLRNMSVVAEIQSAIAIIRKHIATTATGIEDFLRTQADRATTQPGGRTTYLRRYAPGTILDASAGIDYEFPAAGIDAARYVAVLQAELRAIASRLVMPEFMLTADASNANYSSTLVAEAPAVRMFERLQHDLIDEDVELLRRVIGRAVSAGRLPAAALTQVDLHATAPTLAIRDRLRDAQADEILLRCGALTPAQMAERHGIQASDLRLEA